MSIIHTESASFRALSEATAQDWSIIERAERHYRAEYGPGAGLLTLMAAFAHIDAQGAPINVYQHCLQTATRALEAGADDELVVVALFHDLPEAFSDNHHGRLAAQILAPRLSERRSWLLTHHVEFQAYHFANHPTRDRHERDQFAGHPYFEQTAEFCAKFDQNSFDPAYPTLPLEGFEPIVRRFFARPLAAIAPRAAKKPAAHAAS